MDSIEQASLFLGTSSLGGSRRVSYTNVTRAVATSNSSSGYVMVNMGGTTVSEDDDQFVKLPTTVAVFKGDIVEVSLTGEMGRAKTPVVTGVIGGGDRTSQVVSAAQQSAMDAQQRAASALDTATTASSLADSAHTKAEEAKANASSALSKATEAQGIANSVSSQVDTALSNANTALEKATTAEEKSEHAYGLAEDAIELATTSVVSNVVYYQVAGTIPPETGDESIENWSSTIFGYEEGLTTHCWQSTRTVIGDGTVTWSEPTYEANWEVDLKTWLGKFTDCKVYVLLPDGVTPNPTASPDPGDESVQWSETTLVPSEGQQLWNAMRRRWNNGDEVYSDIGTFSDSVAKTLWYYQQIVDPETFTTEYDGAITLPSEPYSVIEVMVGGVETFGYSVTGASIAFDEEPDDGVAITVSYVPKVSTPTGPEPSGWAMTPPVAGEFVDGSVVFGSVQTINGDGSIEWSEPEANMFASELINTIYSLRSIKSNYTTEAEMASSIEQTSKEIRTEVSEKYVEVGTSGVSNLGSVIAQSSDRVTFGFTSTSNVSSSVTSMVFDEDGMAFIVNGSQAASYGSVAIVGEPGKPRVSISASGMELFGDVDNPNVATARISGNTLWAKNAEVDDYLIMGDWRFYQRANGNMTLKWVG